MIRRLKRRFIVLAMVSLAALLAVIVAGMNIINYQTVVRDADARIEVLEENSGRLLNGPGTVADGRPERGPYGSSDDPFDKDDDPFDRDDDDFDDGPFFGRGGAGGPSMTRDEAEESRFFMVILDDEGNVLLTNVERISSIDESEAAGYAAEAFASGRDEGFIDDLRYSVDEEEGVIRITFLDCGRVLESFRSFLRASIMMSLLGLLIVFGVICYFAGRIVRPVAESYEKQKRFITDAGHEIKTPLAIIKANIDLMDMEIDSGIENGQNGPKISADAADSLKEDLGDINDQVTRLTELTNDLVYLSRMEETEHSIPMTDVPLSDIVSETVSSFEALARENGKTIASDISPAVTVKGSTKDLEKLLSILLENAVKYSVPPAIRVFLRKEGRHAVIEVCNDTENELTNEQLSHVFERFYRTDTSRNSAAGGHGIGLSMANAIVNAHGGRISARTSTGHDFIVTAALPLR